MSFGVAAFLGLLLGAVVAEAVVLPLALIVGLSGPTFQLASFVWGVICGFAGVTLALERWT